ncbi:hypothetical protein EW145_g2413 [Phellinidium pouzarii]|uniref:Fungal-type protein kinase domain-containing protein n=1 Tax=Phellinidium pouzarii TaxID=167371 RepID=A0A4S4LCV3_9AGAM|nr:hypothetical protein EW145_g2413 [Phellinidium pouzarii]
MTLRPRSVPGESPDHFREPTKTPVSHTGKLYHVVPQPLQCSQTLNKMVYLAHQENGKNLHLRHHCRAVSRENAETQYSVENLSDMFAALANISAALKYIYVSGWAHRDISSYNIYLYNKREGQDPDKMNGGQTLDDTSKMHNSSNRSSGRQVSRNTDETQVSKDTNENPIEAFDNIAEKLFEKLGAGASVSVIVDEQKVKSQGTGVWYITLHDMEPLRWIAVWKLFLYEDPPEKRTEMERSYQADKANLLFPHLLNFKDRYNFLTNKSIFSHLTSYLPNFLNKVVDSLNELRAFLLSRYTRAEAEAPERIDKSASKAK